MSPPLSVLATFVSITVATIGIINSLVLSKFNERKLEKRSLLSRYISKLEDRATLPTQATKHSLMEKSIKILKSKREKTRILNPRSYENFIGLLPFALFLTSFLVSYVVENGLITYSGFRIDANLLDLTLHWLFIFGVIFLVPYVFVIVKLLQEYLELSSPKRCDGELNWVDFRSKEISRSFSEENMLRVRVRFRGVVANGFIDTLLIYTNPDGEREFMMWVPDKSTYMSPTSYDQYGILHVDPNLDTGLLQGPVDEIFDLEFRVGASAYNRSAANPISDGRGGIHYENYLLPQGFRIKQVKIRMYVDPVFVPRLERTLLPNCELVIRNNDVSRTPQS
ncbi:hypothetical protein MUP01_00695 [Candidatus Bathyarchaeota archaeon]|nr:hypothetical protein [Candidatus Bathyarchaeota archaeon]